MKIYRSTRALLSAIEDALESNRPCARLSPLDEVAKLLMEGRHYGWAGIYVAVERERGAETLVGQVEMEATRSKILLSMRLSGREYGILGVESERRAFRPEDRVFLERVASLVARFLAGRGKYLVRQTRRSAVAEKAQAAVA